MDSDYAGRTILSAVSAISALLGQTGPLGQPEQSRTDTPAAQPENRAPGAALNPRLDANRQVLAPLEGRWTARIERLAVQAPTRRTGEGPASAPGGLVPAAEVSVERSWVLGRAFLQESVAEGARGVSGLVFWGYDDTRGRFSAVYLDGENGRIFLQYGLWNPDAGVIVFRGQAPSGDRAGAMVLRLTNPDQQVLEVYAGNAPAAREQAPPPREADTPAETPGGGQDSAETDTAPPGVAKLPPMNPPDQSPAPTAGLPDVPIDEQHLIYRVTYTRADAYVPQAPPGQPATTPR